jgi:hypothetical protein
MKISPPGTSGTRDAWNSLVMKKGMTKEAKLFIKLVLKLEIKNTKNLKNFTEKMVLLLKLEKTIV